MVSMKWRHGGAQGIVAIIAIICIIGAAWVILRRIKTESREPVSGAYYYCEDCDYEFTGPDGLIPPIKCPKAGGLTAVRAYKFKGQDGEVFTGYYEKYDMQTKRLIEAKRRGEKVDDAAIKNSLFRAPDDDQWVDSLSFEGIEIRNTLVSPTDGSAGEELEAVYPKREKK